MATGGTKEGIDPNVVPNSAMRKRATPGSSSPAKRLQKRRMSMRNRRVSFAPDPELTMVHTFEKEDYHPGGMQSPQLPIVQEAPSSFYAPDQPIQQQQQPPSPTLVDMEMATVPLSALPAVQEEPDAVAAGDSIFAAAMPGDITMAVPSLAALAEADELAELELQPPSAALEALQSAYHDQDNITAAVPRLGALLEEDEAEEQLGHRTDIYDVDGANMELTMVVGGALKAAAAAEQAPAEFSFAPAAAVAPSPRPEVHYEQLQQHQQQKSPSLSPEVAPKSGVASGGGALPGLSPVGGDGEENEDISPTDPTGVRQEGQANKWGFVPGDDDTMELDLEEHGRMIMGDHTYNRMYGDAVTGRTTAGGEFLAADDTADTLAAGGVPKVVVAEEEDDANVEVAAAGNEDNADGFLGAGADGGNEGGALPAAENGEQQQPNWTLPAFMPPYLAEEEQHPALRHSPDLTNSSMNTRSTRQITVDARRSSVNSRGPFGLLASPAVLAEVVEEEGEGAPNAGTGNLLQEDTGGAAEGGVSPGTGGGGGGTASLLMQEDNNAGDMVVVAPSPEVELQHRPADDEDMTGDLLADDEDINAAGGGGDPGNLLAGLQQQVRMLSNSGVPSPGMQQQFETAPVRANALHVAAKTPFSVGYADSSYNPTAALLRTGGTTNMLKDDTGVPADGTTRQHDAGHTGFVTNATHGTTRLLAMDATASSAIAAGAKALLAEHASPAPHLLGHGRMTTSPPASALSAGNHSHSVGRGGFAHAFGATGPAGYAANHIHTSQHHQAASLRGSPAPAHSARSASVLGVTPGVGHRLARTPGSIAASAAAGGAAQGWTGPYPPPPGSAIAARYPGSAVATGRLSQGFTPSALPPITFQDFAKVVEVQFLDNLRRGSSINYADLAPNTVPASLNDAYTLLCVTSPTLAELETAVHTLRSEASRLRTSASEMEVVLGQANPPIFRHVQMASTEQLEAFRGHVGLLKKVCRAKAVVLLKDVRCQMEQSKAGRLARAAEGLHLDLAHVEECASHTRGVAAAAQKYADATRERLAREADERTVEAERRKRVAAAREALAKARAANAARRERLEAAAARAEELGRERDAAVGARQEAVAASGEARAALVALAAVEASSAAGVEPRAVLQTLRAVSRLEACLGVKMEQATAGSVALRVGPYFSLRLAPSGAEIRGSVELVTGSGRDAAGCTARSHAERALAAAVSGFGPAGGGELFCCDRAGAPAAVQAAVARLQRCTDLASELRGVRAACRHLVEVDGEGGSVRLLFAGLHSEVRFAVTLAPGPAYPLGDLRAETKIWFDGGRQVTSADVAAAVARAAVGPGRIRAACMELSDLVDATAPNPAGAVEVPFHSSFVNPLVHA